MEWLGKSASKLCAKNEMDKDVPVQVCGKVCRVIGSGPRFVLVVTEEKVIAIPIKTIIGDFAL